jgi:ribonuclease HI
MEILLYTDGACIRNPGPGGYAAILIARDDTGTVLKEKVVTGGAKNTTNNRMEMMAIIRGLEALERPTTLTVYTDSAIIADKINNNWKKKTNLDLWARLDRLRQIHSVKFVWIKGHAGDEYNERCDQLAVAQSEHYSKPETPDEPEVSVLPKLL